MADLVRWFGYNVPFLSRGRIMDYQEDEKLIKNDLLQLLLTSPGERVMRPNFGTQLRGFVFENITPVAISLLKENILQAIESYEPRVDVTSISFKDDSENNTVTLQLAARLNIKENRQLFIEVGLPFDGISKEVKLNRVDIR